MWWLFAIAVVIALSLIPLGIRIIVKEKQLLVWMLFGAFKLTIVPGNSNKKTVEKAKTPKVNANKSTKQTDTKRKVDFKNYYPVIQAVLDFLYEFKRKIRVNDLQVAITLASADPCDLAVNYGKTCAAIATLDPLLERFFIIKKKHIHVGCDFVAEATNLYCKIDFVITLGNILHLLVWHGIKILKELFTIRKLRKAA